MRYFNDKSVSLFENALLQDNLDNFKAIVNQLFNSIFKYSFIDRKVEAHKDGSLADQPGPQKAAHHQEPRSRTDLQRQLQESSIAVMQLLTFAHSKKDASYLEFFVHSILNQKPEYFLDFQTELMEFMKLKSDGGPRSDLQRVKVSCHLTEGLEIVRRSIFKFAQRKEPEDAEKFKEFLKSSSKELKRVLGSVVVGHSEFKTKVNSIVKKYLELGSTLLSMYQQCGLGKRFRSLQELLVAEKGNLPKDAMIEKTIKKIQAMKMVTVKFKTGRIR
jgi:hypothetical protein